jgi:hypothetical protein
LTCLKTGFAGGQRIGGMTRLAFQASEGPGCAEILFDGPAELTISHDGLYAGNTRLASYGDGGWHIGNQRLARIVCEGTVAARFETAGTTQAARPLSELCLAGDIALAGGETIAVLRPPGKRWFLVARDASVRGCTRRKMLQATRSARSARSADLGAR